MAAVTLPLQGIAQVTLLRLARELAIDLNDVDTILKNHDVSLESWGKIKDHPLFVKVLKEEIALWESAKNTEERVKIKAASMIEHWLPELYSRLNNGEENLAAKIEGAKFAAKLAGMGLAGTDINAIGERFSVTINLGADSQLVKIDKLVTPQVIEHEPLV
jgi:hypothetical protein